MSEQSAEKAREALADYLTRKAGPAKLPIGARVSVRSFKGAVGTVVGPDGHPKGEALAVRMDRPYPEGFRDGYACVSVEECSVIPPEEPCHCLAAGRGGVHYPSDHGRVIPPGVPCDHDTLGCGWHEPHEEHTKVGDGRPCCGWPPRCRPTHSAEKEDARRCDLPGCDGTRLGHDLACDFPEETRRFDEAMDRLQGGDGS